MDGLSFCSDSHNPEWSLSVAPDDSSLSQSHVRAIPSPVPTGGGGRWALPHGEFGLDIIALIGTLRYKMHQSVPEIHQELAKRGVVIAERTVTNLLARYDELVTLHLADQTRLRERLTAQGHVILA